MTYMIGHFLNVYVLIHSKDHLYARQSSESCSVSPCGEMPTADFAPLVLLRLPRGAT